MKRNRIKAGRFYINMSGKRFCRWTVLRFSGIDMHGAALWQCLCDCGTKRVVIGQILRNGSSISCGCYAKEILLARQTKHGGFGTREYGKWRSMKSRCCNPHNRKYALYGGRGIHVCERWSDFSNFMVDMGMCPPGLTLERIDNNGNYEPGNCRWATRKEQARNKRCTVYIYFEGSLRPLSEVSEIVGVSTGRLYSKTEPLCAQRS